MFAGQDSIRWFSRDHVSTGISRACQPPEGPRVSYHHSTTHPVVTFSSYTCRRCPLVRRCRRNNIPYLARTNCPGFLVYSLESSEEYQQDSTRFTLVMLAVKYLVFGLLPLVSAFTWLGPSSMVVPGYKSPHRLTNVGMLLAMLIVWELEGHPHYASMDANQKIAYEPSPLSRTVFGC